MLNLSLVPGIACGGDIVMFLWNLFLTCYRGRQGFGSVGLGRLLRAVTPLLAAPVALLLSQGEAKAVLVYNIFESAGNVVVETSGSLNLTGATQLGTGSLFKGSLLSQAASIGTGIEDQNAIIYSISSGPPSFNGTVNLAATNVAGIYTSLVGDFFIGLSLFGLDSSYVSGTPIVSSATFANKTLAGIGFTISSGLLGSWTLDGTSETIYACLGIGPCPQSPASVPGPLPLLGAGAAFGWSRRLRKRIATPSTTPQA